VSRDPDSIFRSDIKIDSCFYCVHHLLCFLNRGVDDLVKKTNMLNNNGTARPGSFIDIYKALGSSCLMYERNKNES